MSELRWNPLLEEWVITASHRQERTFFPPPGYCPLCPTQPGGFPTEVAEPDYDVVVLQNKFPSLRPEPATPAVAGHLLTPVLPAQGECEVVLYSPRHEATLVDLGPATVYKLVQVWRDRYQELGARSEIDYVFIFENRGPEVGVTLTHPHGQIYAFPYVPPVVQRELAAMERYWYRERRCLLCDLLRREIEDGVRLISHFGEFRAVVPFYARFPYEVHVLPERHLGSLSQMSPEEDWGLAQAIHDVVARYDALYDGPMPYMMVLHQNPSDGGAYRHHHFHLEFYPLRRSADKLKYRAGCETGAGTFITDALPETWAEELRRAGG
ncbi:MAG: galactose-1-phosphate uridylyltransferase [Anaerolineae bacterium]|nr:galactose-1-phosphate uridylyltransferase [Anaerolineae bacterium]